MNLLSVDGLTIALPPGGERAHAIEDVSLALGAGEILCVVGESGSGKSMTASAVMAIVGDTLTGGVTPPFPFTDIALIDASAIVNWPPRITTCPAASALVSRLAP